MKSSNQKPAIYKFHSTPHLYLGLDEPDILLEIYEYGVDGLEVKLINRDLPHQKKNMKYHITLFMLTTGIYLWLHLNRILCFPYVEIVLAFWFAILIGRFSHLVVYEKFIFCYDFGLHLQTQRIMSNSSTFIVASNIYDISINEVIENLDFRYLLIVRTKGKLFRKNPIIPVFKVLKPSCDCLSLVYKHLNKVMLKEPTTSSSATSQQL